MAVNKNFVVKNGLEVNTNLLVADLDTQTVGIGTTIAPHELHVVGGIGVTNLNVTGVATIANLRIGGISTFVGFTTFLSDINVGGASTFKGLVDINGGGQANTFKVEDLTDNRVVIAGTGGELEDSSNFVFDGSQLILGVGATVGGALTVAGATDLNSTLDVSGNVSLGSSLDVTGLTELGDVNVSAASTFGGLVDINAGGQANTFKVEDLTDNRVVLAGTGGELEDSGNLTFDGTQLVVTGVATVSGAMTAGSFSVGSTQVISSARQLQNIASLDSTTTATIESAIANAPNTFTDLQITGIATFKNDVEFHGANGITSSFFDQSANALKFVDDTKALFGTGDDLQILHNGTDSEIINNTGDLSIKNNANDKDVVLQTDNGSGGLTNYVLADGSTGEVVLYHLGSRKLETKSTGIDVTGRVEADDVNVSGGSTFTAATFTSTVKVEDLAPNRVVFVGAGDSLTDDANFTFDRSQLILGVGATVGGALTVAGISSFNDDVSFGTGFFYDNSTGRLGVGIQVPGSTRVHVKGHSSLNNSLLVDVNSGDTTLGFAQNGTEKWRIENVDSDDALRFYDVSNTSERLRITAAGDVEFKGANGITSMSFDRSSNSLDFVDGAKAHFGTGDDLQIYHNGTDSIIADTGTGNLNILGDADIAIINAAGNEYKARFTSDGAAELYYDGSKKLETTNSGVIVTGIASITASSDPTIKIENTDSSISADQAIGSIEFKANDGSSAGDQVTASIESVAQAAFTGQGSPSHLIFSTNGASGADALAERLRITHEGDVEFKGAQGVTTAFFDRSANALRFVDSAEIQVGTGDDLRIYHDGNSRVRHTGAGDLLLQSNSDVYIQRASDGHQMIVAENDGPVKLYHDNTERFKTTSDGVIVTGIGTFDSTKHISIPVGTTAERSAQVANGMIRYNTTLNSYEGYGNGAWGGLGGGTEIDTTVSTTNPTGVGSFAAASYRSAMVRLQINQLNTDYQVGRYMLIHDGTTVTVLEEAAVSTGSTMVGSITGVIDGSNVELRVTLASAGVSTVTTIFDKITV